MCQHCIEPLVRRQASVASFQLVLTNLYMHKSATNVTVIHDHGTALALLYFVTKVVSAELWQITLETSQAMHAQCSAAD